MNEEEKKARIAKWLEVKHFKYSEFDSPDLKDSGLYMNHEFIKLLDQGRAATGFPWIINSGFRTLAHNEKVGGQGPEHCEGNAVDIRANSTEKFAIAKWALDAGFKRIGIAKNFIHIGFSYELPQGVIWTY